MKPHTLILLYIVLTLSLLSCTKDMRQSFSDMIDLQKALADHYSEPAPAVNITNGSILTVTFVNSSFNTLTGDAKKEKAKEIATFVKQHYSHIQNITTINLRLVKQKRFLIFSSNTFEVLSFETQKL